MDQAELINLSKYIDAEKKFRMISFGLSVALTITIFIEDRLAVGLSITLVCFSFFNLFRSYIFGYESQIKNILLKEKIAQDERVLAENIKKSGRV